MIPTVLEMYRALEARIPRTLSCEWDNDGLMVCENPNKPVKTVLFALDVTDEVISYAIRAGADVILSHHPLIFRPVAHLTMGNLTARKSIALLSAGISVMSFHTRFDAVTGGINDLLAAKFSLTDVSPFGPEGEQMGRIGTLPRAMSIGDFCKLAKKTLGAPTVSASDSGKPIRRLAVLGGGGGDLIAAARKAGADALLTGEAGYNAILDAAQDGLSVVTAGHYYTEQLFREFFKAFLQDYFPEVNFVDFPQGCEILTF